MLALIGNLGDCYEFYSELLVFAIVFHQSHG